MGWFPSCQLTFATTLQKHELQCLNSKKQQTFTLFLDPWIKCCSVISCVHILGSRQRRQQLTKRDSPHNKSLLSHVRLFTTLWSVQPTRLLCPWGFSRPEYWSQPYGPCSPPGCSVHGDSPGQSTGVNPMVCVAHQAALSMGILQARILEWLAISFFRRSTLHRD